MVDVRPKDKSTLENQMKIDRVVVEISTKIKKKKKINKDCMNQK